MRIFKDWISRESVRRNLSSHARDEWSEVKRTVEQALPFYDTISEAISLGLAGPLRRRAIRKIEYSRNEWVLDSGSGPGVSSEQMLSDGFTRVVGLDPSLSLLTSTKARLGDNFHPVQAIAENIPLRSMSISGIIACFSLRDVRDKTRSISEFSRLAKDNGLLEIVDVGKPESQLSQGLIRVYVSLIMPVLARVLIGRRARSNPFRMIIPTFRRLSTNRSLTSLVSGIFGPATLHQFMLGGLVIVEGTKDNST